MNALTNTHVRQILPMFALYLIPRTSSTLTILVYNPLLYCPNSTRPLNSPTEPTVSTHRPNSPSQLTNSTCPVLTSPHAEICGTPPRSPSKTCESSYGTSTSRTRPETPVQPNTRILPPGLNGSWWTWSPQCWKSQVAPTRRGKQ